MAGQLTKHERRPIAAAVRIMALKSQVSKPNRSGGKVAQHVVQNAAVLEVLDLIQRIDPA